MTTNQKNKAYELNLSFSILDLIESVIDRIEDPTNEEHIFQAIDESIIYYDDQWTILQEYCSPQEANWNNAIEQFIQDVFAIAQTK